MKIEFLSALVVEEIDDGHWKLTEPFRALIKDDPYQRHLTVPAGFVTDFASVPRIPIAYELVGGRANKPAVLHDYLYTIGGTELDRLYADDVLLAAMKADGLDSVRAQAMYDAVRQCGAEHFGTHDEAT